MQVQVEGSAGQSPQQADLDMAPQEAAFQAVPKPVNKGGRPRRLDKPMKLKEGPPILRALRARELGLGVKLLASLERRYKGDPFTQIAEFFGNFTIPAATGRKRTVGILTEKIYVDQMNVLVKDLKRLNMGIQNLSEISTRHIKALTDLYVKESYSASSLAKKNTVQRRFGIWIGKPDLAPRLADLVANPHSFRRHYSAKVSKAWSAKQIDPHELIQRMKLECPVAAMHLEFQLLFGLRPREAVMMKPFSADQGNVLFVTDGTKGGRARPVPIDTPAKRDLVERAKAVAAGNARRVLTAKPSQPLHAAVRRYYHLAHKVGITKSELGITLHGLRHHFANELYKQVTGFDSPVNGGPVLDPELAERGAYAVAEQLGHARKAIASAYIGHHRTISLARKANIMELLGRLEKNDSLLSVVREAGLAEWWVIGEPAGGAPVGATLQLAYRAPVLAGQEQMSADVASMPQALRVAEAAGKALGCMVLPCIASTVLGSALETLELVGWDANVLAKQPADSGTNS